MDRGIPPVLPEDPPTFPSGSEDPALGDRVGVSRRFASDGVPSEGGSAVAAPMLRSAERVLPSGLCSDHARPLGETARGAQGTARRTERPDSAAAVDDPPLAERGAAPGRRSREDARSDEVEKPEGEKAETEVVDGDSAGDLADLA